jgi:DHA2 family methylenomycin A resistance protein-like MFS transporter
MAKRHPGMGRLQESLGRALRGGSPDEEGLDRWAERETQAAAMRRYGRMAAGLLLAGGGLALLGRVEPDSGYLVLLPAFALWGLGLAVLTPSVVAAAVASVPRDRAGLASAINNTSRQAGGAIGIAASGAIAGSPKAAPAFIGGMHADAFGAAALYAIAAAASLRFIPTALSRM